MEQTAFEAKLRADGYTEIETKSYEARPANGEHGHHFSVRGLILAGAFTVAKEGMPRTYGPGEIFEVEQGLLHHEEVGAGGVQLVVGRKY